ncbi:hypothetical protein C8J57DRAFT_1251311 [Mycena rebaudengoi]|nr:hypothetical protein C8J57DRAFT_1251311 [Mycena rebaudengoi]
MPNAEEYKSKTEASPKGPLNDAPPTQLITTALRLLHVADAYLTWLTNGGPPAGNAADIAWCAIVEADHAATLRALAVVVFAAQDSWPENRVTTFTTALPVDIPLKLIDGRYAFVLNLEVEGGFPLGVVVGAFYSN